MFVGVGEILGLYAFFGILMLRFFLTKQQLLLVACGRETQFYELFRSRVVGLILHCSKSCKIENIGL